MLIEDLPSVFKALALKNQELQQNDANEFITLGKDAASCGFNYNKTPEGMKFWRYVSHSEFDHPAVLTVLKIKEAEMKREEKENSLDFIMNEINNL
jgi:hypothetical protein